MLVTIMVMTQPPIYDAVYDGEDNESVKRSI